MIEIHCPKCQCLLAFDDARAGSVLTCPDCAAKVVVPAQPDVADPRQGIKAGFGSPAPALPPLSLDEFDEEDRAPPSLTGQSGDAFAEGALSSQDEEVLAELGQLQNQQQNWTGAIGLLLISLVLWGAAAGKQIWDGIFILIPVLLFHELGHYLAMRGFGYRNLRMFFIPFFGAAVAGRHYNILGWKKALVALAGPLPGIFAGSFVGAAGLVLNEPTVISVALCLLLVNGMNLLPFLPLDGGWVVHAVLFVRHPVLDVVFRVVAALTVLGLAALLRDWCLGFIGTITLLTAPLAFRLARIAHHLGREGLVARSLDGQSIPPQTALRILAELRRAMPPQTTSKVLAQHVANVFETFNAEPPGVLATLGLLTLHAGSFVLALVMCVIILMLQHGLG